MEIFKAITGYEGLYAVSNYGQVKSLPKTGGNAGKERLLKHDVHSAGFTGYSRVTLSKEGKTKRYSVHQLVAQEFLPQAPDGFKWVNHKDNNAQNNHVDNLEWSNAKHNYEHSAKQGRQDNVRRLGGLAVAKIQLDDFNERMGQWFEGRYIQSEASVTKSGGKGKRNIEFICSVCTQSAWAKVGTKSYNLKGICKNCLSRMKI